MKNTDAPAGHDFIRGDGRIHRIVASTKPLSEALGLRGGAVLRGAPAVAGGLAKKLGIAPGDRVGDLIFNEC